MLFSRRIYIDILVQKVIEDKHLDIVLSFVCKLDSGFYLGHEEKMEKKGHWFSAVKKVLHPDPKDKNNQVRCNCMNVTSFYCLVIADRRVKRGVF